MSLLYFAAQLIGVLICIIAGLIVVAILLSYLHDLAKYGHRRIQDRKQKE